MKPRTRTDLSIGWLGQSIFCFALIGLFYENSMKASPPPQEKYLLSAIAVSLDDGLKTSGDQYMVPVPKGHSSAFAEWFPISIMTGQPLARSSNSYSFPIGQSEHPGGATISWNITKTGFPMHVRLKYTWHGQTDIFIEGEAVFISSSSTVGMLSADNRVVLLVKISSPTTPPKPATKQALSNVSLIKAWVFRMPKLNGSGFSSNEFYGQVYVTLQNNTDETYVEQTTGNPENPVEQQRLTSRVISVSENTYPVLVELNQSRSKRKQRVYSVTARPTFGSASELSFHRSEDGETLFYLEWEQQRLPTSSAPAQKGQNTSVQSRSADRVNP